MPQCSGCGRGGGKCFGYREGDELWTYDGRHVGHFNGDDLFASDGRYLGEIMNGDRLITDRRKKNLRSGWFTPYGKRVAFVKYVDYVGYVMIVGYEDFPGPQAL